MWTNEQCPTKNYKLDHIYVSIYVFAIFDTVPCWYEHIQPQKEINVPPTKGLQQVLAYREKYTFFRTIHFFTLNRTNQILQQNFHELVCQKLTKKLTKKVIYKKTILVYWFGFLLLWTFGKPWIEFEILYIYFPQAFKAIASSSGGKRRVNEIIHSDKVTKKWKWN